MKTRLLNKLTPSLTAKLPLTLPALAIVLSASAISFASTANYFQGNGYQGGGHQGDHGRNYTTKRDHYKLTRMAKHLNLTDQQKQQFKALKQQAKDNRGAIKEKMLDYKAQVKQLIQANDFDEQAFTQLHNTYQDTFAEIAMLKAKHKHQIMHILTTEQKEKAKALRKNKRARHQKKVMRVN